MPPKKTAGSAAKKPATATKAKSVKKVVDPEEIQDDEETSAGIRRPRARAVKKKVADKEISEDEEEPVPKKTVKKTKKAKSSEKQSTSSKDAAPKAKKTTAKAASSKAEKDLEKDESKENGTTKKTTAKKTKDDESEAPSAKEEKTTSAPKAKRGRKPAAEKEAEEKPTEPKKARKRKSSSDHEGQDEPETKSTKLMNATSTSWEEIDFKCTSKNSKGADPNFHITSWNVDGLRAWVKKGGLNILEYDQPDIFCLQEIKCSQEKLPEEMQNIEGYETLWCCSDKEGYAGVAIATKIKPVSVTYGIDSEEHDIEGRCITAEYEKFFLVNVYVPNAGRQLVTLPKRLEWNKLFKTHIKNLNERKPVIICGDMNVAHSEIDLANPKTNTKNAGFTPEEREGMTDFLADGYIDTFRKLYPDKEKAYTFWTYMGGARKKNVGWRLDYFIVSEKLMEDVCDNVIHKDVLGSDHCPLSLHLNI